MSDSVSWLNKIEPEIVKAAGLPTSGMSFSFPIDEFAEKLSSSLSIENLKISFGLSEWKTQENFLSGLGSSPVSLSLQLAPLNGPFFFLMAFDDVVKFISWMKDKKGNPYKVDHADVIKGIYRYVCLEALFLSNSLESLSGLTPRLTDNTKFDQTSYSIDVSLKKGRSVIWARLLISPELKRSLENHFALKKPTISTVQNLPNVKIPMSLQSGSIELTSEELTSLKKGDVVLIENIHYRPSDEKGSLVAKIGQTSIFQIRVKEGKLKILDYTYSYEEPNA